MTTLVAVDPDRLDRMEARIEQLVAALDRATVTPAPEWMTVAEAARYTGRSESTVRGWMRDGVFEVKEIGNKRFVKMPPEMRKGT